MTICFGIILLHAEQTFKENGQINESKRKKINDTWIPVMKLKYTLRYAPIMARVIKPKI